MGARKAAPSLTAFFQPLPCSKPNAENNSRNVANSLALLILRTVVMHLITCRGPRCSPTGHRNPHISMSIWESALAAPGTAGLPGQLPGPESQSKRPETCTWDIWVADSLLQLLRP